MRRGTIGHSKKVKSQGSSKESKWKAYVDRISTGASEQRLRKENSSDATRSAVSKSSKQDKDINLKISKSSSRNDALKPTKIGTESVICKAISNTRARNSVKEKCESGVSSRVEQKSVKRRDVAAKSSERETVKTLSKESSFENVDDEVVQDEALPLKSYSSHSNIERINTKKSQDVNEKNNSQSRRINAIIDKVSFLEQSNQILLSNEKQLREMNAILIRKLSEIQSCPSVDSLAEGKSVRVENKMSLAQRRMLSIKLECFERTRLCRYCPLLFDTWKLFAKRRIFSRLIKRKRETEILSLVLRNWACHLFLKKVFAKSLEKRIKKLAHRCLRKWEEFLWIQHETKRNKVLAIKFRVFNCWIKYVNIRFKEQELQLRQVPDNLGTIGCKIGEQDCEKIIIPSVDAENKNLQRQRIYFSVLKSCFLRDSLARNFKLKNEATLQKGFIKWRGLLLAKYRRIKEKYTELRHNQNKLKKKICLLVFMNRWKNLLLSKRKTLIVEKELAVCSIRNLYDQLQRNK